MREREILKWGGLGWVGLGWLWRLEEGEGI